MLFYFCMLQPWNHTLHVRDIMRKAGPILTLRERRDTKSSLLKLDDRPAGRTQNEMESARQNAKASIALKEALAAALHSGQGKFEDCPIAIAANRVGRAPQGDNTPATNASSVYTSTLETKRRR